MPLSRLLSNSLVMSRSAFRVEGIPTSRGGQVRDDHVLRRLIANDVYRPHTFQKIACLVTLEVAARLNPNEQYRIQWLNRRKTGLSALAEPAGNGGRRYRKRSTVSVRPQGDWIAVPVPAYLPRTLVDRARRALKENSRSFERKHLARGWELRGLVRCSCGSKMRTLTTKTGDGPNYHYYTCGRRRTLGKMCSCTQKSLRSSEVEPPVWDFVSDLLTDPEKIRSGMEALIKQERASEPRNLDREAKVWTKKLAEYTRLRSAYQDQQAAGLMMRLAVTPSEEGYKVNGVFCTSGLTSKALWRKESRLLVEALWPLGQSIHRLLDLALMGFMQGSHGIFYSPRSPSLSSSASWRLGACIHLRATRTLPA